MSTQFYNLTISSVIKETEDTVSISFNVPSDLTDKFKFEAGQYLTLKANINGEDVRRAYSISAAPHENEWKVAIKKVENGKFSTYAQGLNVGDQIDVMAPQGNFTVKSNSVKHYVLVAAGSGITPIISIAKHILQTNSDNRITMFYGNKSASQTIYKSELDALKSDNFNINYVFSRENTDNSILEGRIDADKIKALNAEFLSGSQIDDVYVCGPEDMIFAVKDFYKSQGMSDSNVHFELFTVPTKAETSEEVIDESKEITSQVTVIVDDEEFEFELSSKGKDILQAAQDNDADVPFSCKGGVCCTCKAKVMEGKAKMDLNYALEPEEVEEGFILTCQAHPLTEKVVVSFDEY